MATLPNIYIKDAAVNAQMLQCNMIISGALGKRAIHVKRIKQVKPSKTRMDGGP